MKNSLNHIILDTPFEEEFIRPIPKKEVETTTANNAEIIWEGKPHNESLVSGKNASPLNKLEVLHQSLVFIGYEGVFFWLFYSSNQTKLFFQLNALWIVPLAITFFLHGYLMKNGYKYVLTTTHLIIKTPFHFLKKEIALSKIIGTKISNKSPYPNTGTIKIFLKNKKEVKFKYIKNVEKVRSLLNETISKIKQE